MLKLLLLLQPVTIAVVVVDMIVVFHVPDSAFIGDIEVLGSFVLVSLVLWLTPANVSDPVFHWFSEIFICGFLVSNMAPLSPSINNKLALTVISFNQTSGDMTYH